MELVVLFPLNLTNTAFPFCHMHMQVDTGHGNFQAVGTLQFKMC